VGEEVAYSIRFDDQSTERTRIKYVTDGVLLRECMSNPTLEGYNIIILDEAHERSLQTDILMGLLRDVLESRPHVRLVLMSATLDVDLFKTYFTDAAYIEVPGRTFPVDIVYSKKPEENFLDATLATCLRLHAEEPAGGVLAFLPGQEDIETLADLLRERLPAVPGKEITAELRDDFQVCPLFAAMSPEEQLAAFAPPPTGVRKFVLATNIAETSVTVTGIKFVVDPGFAKVRLIQAVTGHEMLQVRAISQSQAKQRAGRAGRLSAGKCFRLYTRASFEVLEQQSAPEIQRVNIAQMCLQLMCVGVQNPARFPYISPPSVESLRKAMQQLLGVGAIDKDLKVSAHGNHMAKLPLSPQFAHLLLASSRFGCTAEVLVVVSMLSVENVMIIPAREEDKKQARRMHRRFMARDGDFATLVNVYQAWIKANRSTDWCKQNYLSAKAMAHVGHVHKQIGDLLSQMKIDPEQSCQPEREPFLRALTAGLFMNIAKKVSSHDSGLQQASSRGSANAVGSSGAQYRMVVGGQLVHIHPSSALFSLFHGSSKSKSKLPDCVVFAELLITTKQYMRCISTSEFSWLSELVPHLFKTSQTTKR
jgi:HrpA-like RNA helicase